MEIWSCPNGHSWQIQPGQKPALLCPVCGVPGKATPLAETLVRPSAPAAPFMPPPPPSSAVTADLPAPTLTFVPAAAPSSQEVKKEQGELAPARATDVPSQEGETLVRPGHEASGTNPPPEHQDTLLCAGASTHQKRSPFAHHIPGYELLGILGRGGMGIVYKARQVALNRTVALKMILAGVHASDQDLRRFRTEAEAVAQLQHPNIIQIYEIGEQNGLPWFSLEYVEGGSLQQYLRNQPLPPHHAAHLVAQVARAMHHSHQRGIIHRDLKPANILLADCRWRTANSSEPAAIRDLQSAIPKVTDFGLAKKLEQDSDLTGQGTIVGTPNYMSPEQAQGSSDIGTATDIYALGAILYDLLTGRPPFQGSTVMDTLHQVLHAEPVSPTRLHRHIPRDLEIICLKCLEKDPGRRYPTAVHLAEDLEAYIEGRPIAARATPWYERLARWAWRRPAAAALAAVMLLVVLGVAIGAPLVAGWEHQLRAAAEQAQLRAEQQQQLAEKHFEQAKRAVEEMLTRVAADDEVKQPHLLLVRHDLLSRALAFYQDFLQDHAGKAELRREQAWAHLRVGMVQQMLGQHGKARDSFQAARPIFEQLLREQPQRWALRHELAATLDGLGQVYQQLGQRSEAGQSFRAALAELTVLARQPREQAGLVLQLVKVHNNLGGLLREQKGGASEAAAVYRTGLKLLDDLAGDRSFALEMEKAKLLFNLGTLLLESAPTEALQCCEQAVAIQQRWLGDKVEVRPGLRVEQGMALLNLGAALQKLQRMAAARQCYEAALRVLTPVVERFPEVVAFRQPLAQAWNNVALLAQESQDFEAATKAREQARVHWSRLLDLAPQPAAYRRELARNWHVEGLFLASQGQTAQAELALGKAIEMLTQLTKDFPEEVDYTVDLGRLHLDMGNWAARTNRVPAAELQLNRAVTLLEPLDQNQRLDPVSQAVLRDAHLNLALVRMASGQDRQAEANWQRVIALLEQQLARQADAGTREGLAASRQALAGLLRKRSAWAEALPLLEKAVAEQRQVLAEVKTLRNRGLLGDYAGLLLQTLVAVGNHAAVSRQAKALAGDLPASAQAQAAAQLARCLPLVAKDAKLEPKRRAQLSEQYARQALELLQTAVQGGFADRQWLQTGAEWEPLRQRPDWQRWLKELSKGES